MDNYAAAEQSYNNGYRAGFYAGKMGAGMSASWGTGIGANRPCTRCGFRGAPSKFCPECGSAMKNPFKHDTVLD
jgi:hypothetical protein